MRSSDDRCSICGSDLHIYHGHGFSEDIGFCVGHEAVGEVVEIGRAVHPAQARRQGDDARRRGLRRLPLMPCGQCHPLRLQRAVATACRRALQGCQAEAFRVPAADINAVKIPEGISHDQALMMTDALATAWFGARNADIRPGKSVAVIGLGPIGLMAVDSAFVMGAHVVFAIDPVAERRALADARGRDRAASGQRSRRIREATQGAQARLRGRSRRQRRNGRSGAAAGRAARDGFGHRRGTIEAL